jgi:hypothetical protein
MNDLLKNKYLIVLKGTIFSGEKTFLDEKIQALLLVDLASRRIPGYLLQKHPVSTKDASDFILSVKQEFKIGIITIFHLDQQSIFCDEELL